MSRDLGREATRGSAIRLAAELLSRALGMATFSLAAIGLGVDGFGTFAALSAAAALLAQGADLGLQGLACPALVSGRFSLAAVLRTRAALSVAPAAAALGLILLGGPAPRVLGLLLLAALAAGWVELLGIALRARGLAVPEALVLAALRANGLAFVAAALSRGAGLGGVAWAELLSAVLPLAAAAALLRGAPRAPAPPASVATVVRAALPLAVNSVLALASLRLETLWLYLARGPAESGAFAAALKIVEAGLGVPAAISGGALPALTREAADRTRDGARRRTAQAIGALAFPAGLGLALVAPVLPGLLGAGYQAGALPLRILAAALPLMFLNAMLLHGLIAAGRAYRLPWLTAARLGLAAVLAGPAIAAAGAPGAAVGFLAGEALLFALARRECVRSGFAFPMAQAWRTAPEARG